jgi:hypothetical protein
LVLTPERLLIMDAERFDTLTRTFTGAGTRRRALGGLLLGSLGLLGWQTAEDTDAHDLKAKCKKKSGDAKKKCLKKAKKHAAQHASETPPQGPPPCANGIKDGNETDIDCGGSCRKCGTGKTCQGPADCASGYCKNQVCTVPTCSDNVKNGTESDVDCGGSCPRCLNTQQCTGPNDCVTAYCVNNTCQACPAEFAECGTDGSTQCVCARHGLAGELACINPSRQGQNCTGTCPSGQVCVAAVTEPKCIALCGAP